MMRESNLLTEKVEAYGFSCEAGPLESCKDWINLKETTDLWVVIKRWAGADKLVCHTDGYGGWRFMAHTNKAEAQSSADRMNRECFGGQKLCVAMPLLSGILQSNLLTPTPTER